MTSSLHDAVSPFAGSPIASPGGLIPDGMYPSGYTMKLVRDATVVAHGSTMEYFELMLLGHASVYEWAAAHPERRALMGRQTAYSVPLPGNEEVSVVVRHSHHGGLLASVTSDVFRDPRAADELRISWTLRHVGIPTPRVLGFVLYPVMYGQLWRADVVTREITNAKDLATILSVEDAPAEHERAIDTTIVLLRKLARTWAYHPDLNVKNILIATDDDAAETDADDGPGDAPPADVIPQRSTPAALEAVREDAGERADGAPGDADAPPPPPDGEVTESTAVTPEPSVAPAVAMPSGRQLAYVLDVDTLRFAEKKAEWMNVARLVRSARKWQEKTPGPGFARLIERLGG
ncbi:MAG: hypothetical protein IT355_00745 [Gemmatimonadaceae bacterium]|nr:hypothetical protein [Gemmatimonadaceae bacterium]